MLSPREGRRKRGRRPGAESEETTVERYARKAGEGDASSQYKLGLYYLKGAIYLFFCFICISKLKNGPPKVLCSGATLDGGC